MYQKERLERILDFLNRNGFATVKELTELLHYSTATVNRDLNALEQMKKIKRSYGGAEPVKDKSVPLPFRYEKMKAAKKRIGKAAAALIEDGDTVFIDNSTTAQYIGRYITEKKNLTVITNNIMLASFLAEAGITVKVLGGTIVEVPSMIAGPETAEQALRYRTDKAFFATSGISEDGVIQAATDTYILLEKAIISRTDKAFYLVDSDKVGRKEALLPHTLADVAGVISDYSFDEECRKKYPNTHFITV